MTDDYIFFLSVGFFPFSHVTPFLLENTHESFIEPNIYADKSSIILAWLLCGGIEKKSFSIREIVRETHISIGLVQKVIKTLVIKGFLQTEGIRTAKKFILKKSEALLKSWLDHYALVKKCKMWTYRTGIQDREQILQVLGKSNLSSKVMLALHSAAKVYGCKNTNLQTLELYLLEPQSRLQIEELLQLESQERGYEILLIEPYYKKMLDVNLYMQHSEIKQQDVELNTKINNLSYTSVLMTFLDLYHFPLRGQEQAIFMAERLPELKRIYKK